MVKVAEPWKKGRSKSSSQRTPRVPSHISDGKETILGEHMSSDEDVPKSLKEERGIVDEEEEGEEDFDVSDDSGVDEDHGPPADSEMKTLAEITKLHGEVLTLCERKDDGESKTRPGKFTHKFEPQHKNILDASGENKKTLLRNLAKTNMKGSGLQSFLRWLMKTYLQLILEKDSDQHTALYTAMVNQNRTFIRMVCKHSEVRVEALEGTGSYGTCLHKALELQSFTSKSVPIIKEMILVLESAQHIPGEGDGGGKPLQRVLCNRDDKGNTPLHIVLKTIKGCAPSEINLELLVEIAITLIEKHLESMYKRNDAKESPYDCLGAAKEADVCKIMLDEMKKIIMRKSLHNEVIDLLYANRRNKLSIFFDISQSAEKKIQATELDGRGKHLQSETILQHVDLPNLTISGGDDLFVTSPPETEHSSNDQTPKGRVDFVKIFNWLRGRGVRKVLEANVEDDEIEPHSDEAIEMALKDLDIEILNWKKLDLCTDVLVNAVNSVKVLYLYSSANNDVLRSWSAPDGLAKLPKLEKVHLSIREGYTTEKRKAEYLKDFRERLQDRVELCLEKTWWTKHAHESSMQGDLGPGGKHPWLDCMYQFSMIVRNNHESFKGVKPEVRVVIIDDGIDDRLAIFRGRIARGKSFLRRRDRSDRPTDYYVRPGGHGTQMAKLICQIFPYAMLYIIRLDECIGEKEERQIDIDSATKAVEWATQNSVHIISMSWSIGKKDLDSGKRDTFQESIRLAYNNGITMFCAASDHGMNSESTAADDIPAAFLEPIKIGASKADGTPWTQVGHEQVEYYLPGHKVVLDGYQPAKGQPQSGSSLATAVAAGLAALLQYCNSIGSYETDKTKTCRGLTTSKTRVAFSKLSPKSTFPEVKTHFGDTKDLDYPEQVKAKYRKIALELQLSEG